MSGHPTYRLLPDGTFVIENYNQAKPFSSFFPGIAGLDGVPMWVFYVNRGQGIASFGVKNKDNAIMEFYPANNAYALTPTMGFRTFLKITMAQKSVYHEPFAMPDVSSTGIAQTMRITAHDLVIEETHAVLGIRTRVRYYTLPREPLAALVRVVEIENTGKVAKDIEVVDGMPKLIPYWISQDLLKNMSYTAQAWATVTNVDKKAPFYRLKVEIGDKPEVTVLRKGNFYFAVAEAFGMPPRRTDVIVDPEIVFGQDRGFIRPRSFIDAEQFSVPAQQFGDNVYPCAMGFSKVTLQPGKIFTLSSVVGHADSEHALNAFAAKAGNSKYFELKSLENQKCIDDVTSPVFTQSNVPAFDLYCKQTYLDNLLRGGTPILLPKGKERMVFYVHSRKHGDLERDYNYFQLSPTYYSQGNGNFRDMNQNKRNDVFFLPQMEDHNVLAFYNLMQMDSYNPLLVKGMNFHMPLSGPALRKILAKTVHKDDIPGLEEFLKHHFEPGSLMLYVDTQAVRLKVTSDVFLGEILGVAECSTDAEHGEGFWTDHWTYNLDLLESFAALYPEREQELVFDKREFTFYDNTHIVVPRSEKYVVVDGKVRQFGAVVGSPAKGKMLRTRTQHRHVMRDRNGTGKVYRTTLAVKMLCLVVNKMATLDPDGIGIEMEAEKPSWYDALNGLPGVFGSSVSETFELKRQILYLRRMIASCGGAKKKIVVPVELRTFFDDIRVLLARKNMTPFAYWDAAAARKEAYRDRTMLGVSGKESSLTLAECDQFLAASLRKVEEGLSKACDPRTGLYYTYFTFKAKGFKKNGKTNHTGLPCVTVQSFEGRPLPLFLESQVHYLKTETDAGKVAALHRALHASPLFDKELSMYKVNASLSAESSDLGRCTVFTPGWLENESIWLHMEYKYLLELLKAGAYRDFFEAFHKACVCFLPPETYGRSILENSSFIASSAFFNRANWGRGFVARLSGSTAEFVDMWLSMTCGRRPFTVTEEGKLAVSFKPVLPGSYFTKNGQFTTMFLGKTVLRYHNPRRMDTFAAGMHVSRMTVTWRDGKTETCNGAVLAGAAAERIRRQEAHTIDVVLSL